MILSLALGVLIWGVNTLLGGIGLAAQAFLTGLTALLGFLAFGLSLSRQLTRQEKTELELQRLNRALKTLSDSNQAMVRATAEAELLHQICYGIVDHGGYRLAWVGYAETDAAKTVRPVAQKGYEQGYLESVNITWDESDRGRGPTGTAIRSGQPCVIQHVATDPRFTPWRDEANRRGYGSVIALPLAVGEEPFGALTIYAAEADAFDADEVTLLTDLADDLAYGLVTLRAKIEREKTEHALRKSEAKNRALFSAIPDMIVRLDQSGTYLEVKAAKDFEPPMPPDKLVGQKLEDVLSPAAAQHFRQQLNYALQTDHTKVAEYQQIINRTPHDFEARIIAYRETEALAIIRDISNRKAREALIEEERARIARDLHDGLAQSLYFLGLKLDYLRKRIDQGPDGIADELHTLKKTVQANIQDVRRTIFSLRPVELDKLGFGPAVEKFVTEFGEQTRLEVALTMDIGELELPPLLEPTFFRLIQEGLNNVAKHAQAKHIRLDLFARMHDAARLTIRDDGIGFDVNSINTNNSAHMGLRQMRERVQALNGQFTIASTPLEGTVLQAEIPLPGEAP
jgi:signal transduction histidine kinase